MTAAKQAYLFLSLFFIFNCVGLSEDFYIITKDDSTVVRWSSVKKQIDTIWKAPFKIWEVALSHNGDFLCFTKYRGELRQGLGRDIGLYSISSKVLKIIRSKAKENYGSQISFNDDQIAFSYYSDDSKDRGSAVYYRSADSIQYGIGPEWVTGWNSDSLLLFWDNEGFTGRNLFSKKIFNYSFPNKRLMSHQDPYDQLIVVNDSLSFFKCMDLGYYIPDVDGHSSNVFISQNGKTKRLLSTQVNAESLFLKGNMIYVGYLDYSKSSDGKKKIMGYEIVTKGKTIFDSFGTLVGVQK